MSAKATCPAADRLVERLHQLGVTEVFGYPGGQLTPIYDALYRTPTVRHRLARDNGVRLSVGRRGQCLDNAVAESFFSSLKKERIKKQIYKNRELAIAEMADYIDTFYN